MGPALGDRYKSVLVEGEGYYYETLLDYVHLNPARAGLIDPHRSQSVLDYPWSSAAGGHALLPTRRPPWLASARALAACGFADTAAGRRRWVKRLDDRASAEAREQCGIPSQPEGHDARRSDLRRGWYWGSQAFAERMLKLGEKVLQKARHRRGVASPEKSAHGEQEALRLVEEGMKLAGLTEDDLVRLPGSHHEKWRSHAEYGRKPP